MLLRYVGYSKKPHGDTSKKTAARTSNLIFSLLCIKQPRTVPKDCKYSSFAILNINFMSCYII
jgi:hypothetical protein